jgi:hypothetical protein
VHILGVSFFWVQRMRKYVVPCEVGGKMVRVMCVGQMVRMYDYLLAFFSANNTMYDEDQYTLQSKQLKSTSREASPHTAINTRSSHCRFDFVSRRYCITFIIRATLQKMELFNSWDLFL